MKRIKNINRPVLLLILLIAGIAAKEADTIVRPQTNIAAIMPISYVGEVNQVRLDEMCYRLQNIAYLYLKDAAVELKIQAPAETNAILLKNGVTGATAKNYSPRELAEMLGVNYILTGMVVQEITGTAYANHISERNDDNGKLKERNERGKNTREINTHIDLSVYDNKGEMVYSKSRRSILADVDAYKNGIHYLLKRSPLFKK